MEFLSFFLKMKGVTAYLCHHVDSGEKKILEDMGESGESPSSIIEQVESGWDPEVKGGADLGQEHIPPTVPEGRWMWRQGDTAILF